MFNELRDAIEMFEMNLDDFNYTETIINCIAMQVNDHDANTLFAIFGD